MCHRPLKQAHGYSSARIRDAVCKLLPTWLHRNHSYCWSHRIHVPAKILSQIEVATNLLICNPLMLPHAVVEESDTKYLVFFDKKESTAMLLGVTIISVSSASTKKYFTLATSFTIWFKFVWQTFWLCCFAYASWCIWSKRGAFWNDPIAVSSAASKCSLHCSFTKPAVVIGFVFTQETAISMTTYR